MVFALFHHSEYVSNIK